MHKHIYYKGVTILTPLRSDGQFYQALLNTDCCMTRTLQGAKCQITRYLNRVKEGTK